MMIWHSLPDTFVVSKFKKNICSKHVRLTHLDPMIVRYETDVCLPPMMETIIFCPLKMTSEFHNLIHYIGST